MQNYISPRLFHPNERPLQQPQFLLRGPFLPLQDDHVSPHQHEHVGDRIQSGPVPESAAPGESNGALATLLQQVREVAFGGWVLEGQDDLLPGNFIQWNRALLLLHFLFEFELRAVC